AIVAELDTRGLIAALASPNGWLRDLASQMLIRKKDDAAVPLLEHVLSDAQAAPARLHALCVLDGMGKLEAKHVVQGLNDVHPAVRRHAVRLAVRKRASPLFAAELPKRVADPDPQVRLQLA